MKIFVPCLFVLLTLITATSCLKEKSIDTTGGVPGSGGPGTGGPGGGTGGNQFEVKIDGTLFTFNLQSATLLRSTADNLKRLDIAGVSTDGNKRLILTFGDTPAAGNGVNVKDYVISLFNEDDPNTPEDESEGNDNGFITYSEKVGNSWLTDVYIQNGVMKITACDAANKKASGTFNITNENFGNGNLIKFTEGKFNNIIYAVLN